MSCCQSPWGWCWVCSCPRRWAGEAFRGRATTRLKQCITQTFFLRISRGYVLETQDSTLCTIFCWETKLLMVCVSGYLPSDWKPSLYSAKVLSKYSVGFPPSFRLNITTSGPEQRGLAQQTCGYQISYKITTFQTQIQNLSWLLWLLMLEWNRFKVVLTMGWLRRKLRG